jgi:ribose/xylose/arabinose/galactoside ABC-type transport system permease subunit
MGLSAICAAHVAMSFGGVLLPALTAVVVGVIAGSLNGLLVTRLRIPSVVVTLAALYAWRGVDTIVSGGTLIGPTPDDTAALGKDWIRLNLYGR